VELDKFREELLAVMEAKQHWAWTYFRNGQVARDRLHVHLEQEYATYVRDFARLVGRAYVQCPVAAVRAELAENIFEEETGGLAAGRPHAELFLEYPRGLGMELGRFEKVKLLPAARAYRETLDDFTLHHGWEIATAVTTLFIEGTPWDRGEIDPTAPKRPEPPLEQHPLVVHYDLSPEHLALTKAHREVEGGHRAAAWRMVLDHTREAARPAVVYAMRGCLHSWLAYRDDVAEACGLARPLAQVARFV